MSKRRDTETLDLFRDFAPKPVVARFEEGDVRAATLSARMSRAVARALKECSLSRAQVAERMSQHLGEAVPVSMIEAYASQGKESHKISAVRLVALAVVTGDHRLLNALLADTGAIAVPARYEALIARELAREARDRLDREIAARDAAWRSQS